MHKGQIKWLALGVVSMLAFAGCVAQEGDEGTGSDVGGADVALDPVAGEVSVKLAIDKTTVTSSERVVVRVTLKNESDHPVRLLSWYAPNGEIEENVFTVTRGADEVEFIGPHYKRPAPVADDFVVLGAGMSVTRELDLSDIYDFAKGSDYNIRYNVSFLRDGARDSVTLSSNDVALWIGSRTSAIQEKPSAGEPVNVTGNVAFTKCDTTQQGTILQGLNAASTMVNGAASYLAGSSMGPRYSTWFGNYTSANGNTAKTHYAAIKDAVDNKALAFDCSCKKTYYAYVYPNQPYKVYVCKAFWSAPMTGTDSKGGTIIHELSHFDLVAKTDDWVYGQSGAKSLAISDPLKALDNADSHEYFAENTPAQN